MGFLYYIHLLKRKKEKSPRKKDQTKPGERSESPEGQKGKTKPLRGEFKRVIWG